ncbi:MAG: DMT family transporter [Burkholderiales bacterium]|nr:DMT family transporter [Burkholderiales bacterium]
MAVWGANLSVVKLLISQFDTMAVATARMVVAGLALAAVLLHRHALWPRLAPRQALTLLGCAVLMVYLNQIFFTEGVARTTAANAELIIALNPLVSALLAALWLGDRLTPARVAGVALGFGGVAMVVLNRPGAALGSGSLGDLLVLCSVVTWVCGGVLVQRQMQQPQGQLGAVQVSGVIHLFGALMLVAHMVLRPQPLGVDFARVTAGHVLMLALSGLLATAMGALVWNRALSTLGVARTALYVYWVPIFGVGFAVALLGEPLTGWHLGGLAAVLGGTWLGMRQPR